MSAAEAIVPSQYEGAAYCTRCLTHMHPSHGPTHARHHETEDALRKAEKGVLETVAAFRSEDLDWLDSLDYYAPGFTDDLAKAERARRAAQKAYDEARR